MTQWSLASPLVGGHGSGVARILGCVDPLAPLRSVGDRLAPPMEALAQSGFVRSGDQPIPGATVTAAQGSATFSTVTDAEGHYGFPPLSAGAWDVKVEMWGFQPLSQQVDYASAKGPVNFSLKLQASPLVLRMQQFMARRNGATNTGAPDQQFEQQAQAASDEPVLLEAEQTRVRRGELDR